MRATLALVAVLVSGCYSYTVQTGAQPAGPVQRGRGVVLFWGLRGTDHHTPCAYGAAWSETYQPWWSPVVSVLTVGIATPWRSEYQCASGQPAPGVVPMAPPPGY